jgi:hypothetical protein
MAWYRNDKAAVAEALKRGERPDLATTMASGPVDELVALDELEVQRDRAGVPGEVVLHTLATLPFVEQASLNGGSSVLFREPAVLLQLGWAPVQIRQGRNGRHRHPQDGKQSPCLVILIPCAIPCVGWGSQRGCMRKRQGSKRSISGSWCADGSMPSMAAG